MSSNSVNQIISFYKDKGEDGNDIVGDIIIKDTNELFIKIDESSFTTNIADITKSFVNDGYILNRIEGGGVTIERDHDASEHWCALNLEKTTRDTSHKYLFMADFEVSNISDTSDEVEIYVYNLESTEQNSTTVKENKKERYAVISKPSSSYNGWQFAFYVLGNAKLTVYRLLCVDLTKEFGVGNEPDTVEEFYARNPIGVDIFTYNTYETFINNLSYDVECTTPDVGIIFVKKLGEKEKVKEITDKNGQENKVEKELYSIGHFIVDKIKFENGDGKNIEIKLTWNSGNYSGKDTIKFNVLTNNVGKKLSLPLYYRPFYTNAVLLLLPKYMGYYNEDENQHWYGFSCEEIFTDRMNPQDGGKKSDCYGRLFYSISNGCSMVEQIDNNNNLYKLNNVSLSYRDRFDNEGGTFTIENPFRCYSEMESVDSSNTGATSFGDTTQLSRMMMYGITEPFRYRSVGNVEITHKMYITKSTSENSSKYQSLSVGNVRKKGSIEQKIEWYHSFNTGGGNVKKKYRLKWIIEHAKVKGKDGSPKNDRFNNIIEIYDITDNINNNEPFVKYESDYLRTSKVWETSTNYNGTDIKWAINFNIYDANRGNSSIDVIGEYDRKETLSKTIFRDGITILKNNEKYELYERFDLHGNENTSVMSEAMRSVYCDYNSKEGWKNGGIFQTFGYKIGDGKYMDNILTFRTSNPLDISLNITEGYPDGEESNASTIDIAYNNVKFYDDIKYSDSETFYLKDNNGDFLLYDGDYKTIVTISRKEDITPSLINYTTDKIDINYGYSYIDRTSFNALTIKKFDFKRTLEKEKYYLFNVKDTRDFIWKLKIKSVEEYGFESNPQSQPNLPGGGEDMGQRPGGGSGDSLGDQDIIDGKTYDIESINDLCNTINTLFKGSGNGSIMVRNISNDLIVKEDAYFHCNEDPKWIIYDKYNYLKIDRSKRYKIEFELKDYPGKIRYETYDDVVKIENGVRYNVVSGDAILVDGYSSKNIKYFALRYNTKNEENEIGNILKSIYEIGSVVSKDENNNNVIDLRYNGLNCNDYITDTENKGWKSIHTFLKNTGEEGRVWLSGRESNTSGHSVIDITSKLDEYSKDKVKGMNVNTRWGNDGLPERNYVIGICDNYTNLSDDEYDEEVSNMYSVIKPHTSRFAIIKLYKIK